MLRPGPPTVESLDDIDRLLGQLTLIGSLERDQQAELDRAVAELKARIKEEQLVEVGSETWSYADWRDKAVEAIRLYAETHRDEVLAGVDGKTRHFANGTISYRAQPPRLVDIDGRKATTEAKFLTAIKGLGAGGLAGAVLRWLAQFTVNEEVAADRLYRVEVKPDRKAVLQLAREKKLTAAWLKARNLKVETGGEDVSIEPAEQLVRSETTQRRAA